jgi:hypothetical protein
VDDTAVLSLRFQKSGTLVLIENCRRTSYGYDQRLGKPPPQLLTFLLAISFSLPLIPYLSVTNLLNSEALGTNGTMLNVTNQGRTSIESQIGTLGTKRDEPLYSFPERYGKAYFEELNHLVEFVEKKKNSVRVTAKDCSEDIGLCQKIQASRVQQFPSPAPSK